MPCVLVWNYLVCVSDDVVTAFIPQDLDLKKSWPGCVIAEPHVTVTSLPYKRGQVGLVCVCVCKCCVSACLCLALCLTWKPFSFPSRSIVGISMGSVENCFWIKRGMSPTLLLADFFLGRTSSVFRLIADRNEKCFGCWPSDDRYSWCWVGENGYSRMKRKALALQGRPSLVLCCVLWITAGSVLPRGGFWRSVGFVATGEGIFVGEWSIWFSWQLIFSAFNTFRHWFTPCTLECHILACRAFSRLLSRQGGVRSFMVTPPADIHLHTRVDPHLHKQAWIIFLGRLMCAVN